MHKVPWKLLFVVGILKATVWHAAEQCYHENTSYQGVSQNRTWVLKTLWAPAAYILSPTKSWVFISSLTRAKSCWAIPHISQEQHISLRVRKKKKLLLDTQGKFYLQKAQTGPYEKWFIKSNSDSCKSQA